MNGHLYNQGSLSLAQLAAGKTESDRKPNHLLIAQARRQLLYYAPYNIQVRGSFSNPALGAFSFPHSLDSCRNSSPTFAFSDAVNHDRFVTMSPETTVDEDCKKVRTGHG
jgi:hypothetical protein